MNDKNKLPTEHELNPSQIADYLHKHPEFFQDHLNLLENMNIPHPSGNAVSLISKQLELFRSKHQELENQLNQLIEIAKDNDTSLNRMHELTLALMEANSIEDSVANLNKVFSDCFLADFVAIKIIKEGTAPNHPIFIDSENDNLPHFSHEFSNNKPTCGRPTLAQAKFLFAEVATDVKSCAIIPMVFTQLKGIIAIGSRDKNRFHHSMGHLFLIQISEVIATRLISLVD